MKWQGLFGFVILSMAANAPQERKADKDLKALAGKWRLVSIEFDGETDLPDDDDIIFEITEKGKVYFEEEFTLMIDSSLMPKIIDLVPQDEKRLQKIEGIYDMKKGVLRICAAFGPLPVLERPVAFDAKAGSKFAIWNLRKVNPEKNESALVSVR